MAINPNTAFSSGAVFTADQANRFPRGVMGYAEATANYLNFTAIGTVLTVTFTAVANRYYRITYHEPQLFSNGAATNITMTIANGATALQQSLTTGNTTYGVQGTAITVETFTAGSITINARLTNTGGINASAGRGATYPAILVVEDIGPS